MKRSIFTLFVICLIVLIPITTNAQKSPTTQNKGDLIIDTIPSNPGPNETVSASMQSYITDINAAQITWMVDNHVIKSGIGEKNFSFKTGSVGTKTTVSVLVITKEGQTITDDLIFVPVGVDIMWESVGYTPPFYKGKALFTYESTIKFIAIPHTEGLNGGEVSPKNLIYKWSNNDVVQDDDSGFGKNTYTVTQGVIARPLNISVEVTSPNSDIDGFTRIQVAPIDPMVLFYEKSPLYGIEFQKALSGTFNLGALKEIAVTAVPYFFGTVNAHSLSYKWEINGSVVDNDMTQTTRVFRPKDETSGTSNIYLSVENTRTILQLASNNFYISFGSKSQ